jgi:hypothetical protein
MMRIAVKGFLALAVVLATAGTYAPSPLPNPAPKLAVSQPSAGPLRVLIVGGGPDRRNNQVAIESNVRYVNHILPSDAQTRVLFANGDPSSKNVLCEDENNRPYYRAPNLPRLDGPAEYTSFKSEIAGIARKPEGSPLLLYFTGHGSPDEDSKYDNNVYDLWRDGELSVRDLARNLDSLPRSTPVTLVMVECFSGAFANLLFEGGSPAGSLVSRPVCGFFASVPQRMAAGCTPEINEADYKDFTGYFFAALAGVDRMGRKITGADYRHDGHIGMDEAYAYALIHDDSIDTPVCTSDVFLRHFVTAPDEKVLSTPYSAVRAWASPPQRAALDALASDLQLQGDGGLREGFDRFMRVDVEDTDDLSDVHLIRFVRLGKSVVLGHMLMATGSQDLKNRYQALLRLEAGNPLRSQN